MPHTTAARSGTAEHHEQDVDPKMRTGQRGLRLVAICLTAAGLLVAGGALALDGIAGDEEREAPTGPRERSERESKRLTPGSGRAVTLDGAGKRHPGGLSAGFAHTSIGAMSAAVRHHQELDLTDDERVQQQLQAIAAPDSPDLTGKGLKEVRQAREQAGIPAGASVTTKVEAVRTRSLDDIGEVVEVWMAWDRSTVSGGTPLNDEMTSVVYTWADGDWKRTVDERWTDHGTYPRAYDPGSPYAWNDGWRRIS